jgi:hypothetical protein
MLKIQLKTFDPLCLPKISNRVTSESLFRDKESERVNVCVGDERDVERERERDEESEIYGER